MKILEAYYDIKIRKDMKRYMLAEGKKLSEIDKLYRQFGTYLSRLKFIAFYDTLLNSKSEIEFRENLDILFDKLWVNHMEYVDMPDYFRRYLSYLHSASALDPNLKIEGLQPPEDLFCIPGSDVTEYAKPYIKDGKLQIIANPLLIKILLPFRKDWPETADASVNRTKAFYGDLLPDMTDDDWKTLIEELLKPKSIRKAKATARNIEFKFPDGHKIVMGGNQAMEKAANDVGFAKLLTMNVLHKGDKIVTRHFDPRYENSYKNLGDGMWLNNKGTVNEKVKTIRVLTALCHLPYTVSLTNEPIGETES